MIIQKNVGSFIRRLCCQNRLRSVTKDRGALWNAVEMAERSSVCRLAREVQVALPLELTMEENIALVQQYVQKNFVSQGMCADIAIHSPPKTNDRHQPVDKNGHPTKAAE